MNALHRILDPHCGNAGKAGEERARRVAIHERPERHPEQEEGEQENHFDDQQGSHRGDVAQAQSGFGEPHHGDHQHEFRKREHFGEDALRAERQGGPEG
jgi:hypothetical protein